MENATKQQVFKKDKHVGEYLLIFIEESWANQDPKHDDWTAGRMEIRIYEDEFVVAIDEKRFCTPKSDEWFQFMNKYNCKWVDKSTLKQVKKTLKEQFYRVDANYNPRWESKRKHPEVILKFEPSPYFEEEFLEFVETVLSWPTEKLRQKGDFKPIHEPSV